MKTFGPVEMWTALVMLPGVIVAIGFIARSFVPKHRWWLAIPGALKRDKRFSEQDLAVLTGVAWPVLASVYALGLGLVQASLQGVFPPTLGVWVLVLAGMLHFSLARVRARDERATSTAHVAVLAALPLVGIWLWIQLDHAIGAAPNVAVGAWIAYGAPLALGLLMVGWQTFVAADLARHLPKPEPMPQPAAPVGAEQYAAADPAAWGR